MHGRVLYVKPWDHPALPFTCMKDLIKPLAFRYNGRTRRIILPFRGSMRSSHSVYQSLLASVLHQPTSLCTLSYFASLCSNAFKETEKFLLELFFNNYVHYYTFRSLKSQVVYFFLYINNSTSIFVESSQIAYNFSLSFCEVR